MGDVRRVKLITAYNSRIKKYSYPDYTFLDPRELCGNLDNTLVMRGSIAIFVCLLALNIPFFIESYGCSDMQQHL
jgi:hypothetical protein